MTKLEFYRELDTIIEAPAGTVQGKERLADLNGWSSIAAISFLMMADEKLGVSINATELAKCSNISDLEALFPGKLES